jgi:hypothetical protein
MLSVVLLEGCKAFYEQVVEGNIVAVKVKVVPELLSEGCGKRTGERIGVPAAGGGLRDVDDLLSNDALVGRLGWAFDPAESLSAAEGQIGVEIGGKGDSVLESRGSQSLWVRGCGRHRY